MAAFILAGNTLLRPLVEFVNRRPISPEDTEALYRVHLICAPEMVSDARDHLSEELERLHYPIREIEVLSEGNATVELAAILVPTRANHDDLDAIVGHLERHQGVNSATWTVSTTN